MDSSEGSALWLEQVIRHKILCIVYDIKIWICLKLILIYWQSHQYLNMLKVNSHIQIWICIKYECNIWCEEENFKLTAKMLNIFVIWRDFCLDSFDKMIKIVFWWEITKKVST